MPALDFPDSPSVNDTFTAGNRTWTWDGTTWNLASNTQVLTTKGDLLTRTSSAVTRLAKGTDGYVLTANSSTSTGLEWQESTSKARAMAFAIIFG